jgi:hypothetical protein
MKRGANIPVSEAARDRPWQLLITGDAIAQIDAATRRALEDILELFTEVGGLVVHTSAGRGSVPRDFPSDYTVQVDRLRLEIFKNIRRVTGIEFLGLEDLHTATPDDPYWSPQGKTYAGIASAAARGGLIPEEAIAAYRRLAAPK